MNRNLLLLALFALCNTGCADHEPGHYEEPKVPQLDIETVTQLIQSLAFQQRREIEEYEEDADQSYEVAEETGDENEQDQQKYVLHYAPAKGDEEQEQQYVLDYAPAEGEDQRSLLKRSPNTGRRYVKYVYRKPLTKVSKGSRKNKYTQQTVFVPEEPCDNPGVGHEVHELGHHEHGHHTDYIRHTTAEESYGYVGSLKGKPGVDYPNYTEIPMTSFSCADKQVPGFYADIETRCQVFHICYKHRRESFLCPIGTIFNQPILACDYWYNGNCSASSQYYDMNEESEEIEEIMYAPDIVQTEVPVEEWSVATPAPNEYPKGYYEEHEPDYVEPTEPAYEGPTYPPAESFYPSSEAPQPIYPEEPQPIYPEEPQPIYPEEPQPIYPEAPVFPPVEQPEPTHPPKTYVKILPVKSKVTTFGVSGKGVDGQVKISSKPFSAQIDFSGFAPIAKGVDIKGVVKPVPTPVVKPIPIKGIPVAKGAINVKGQFSGPVLKPAVFRKPLLKPIPVVSKPAAVKFHVAAPIKAAVKVAVPFVKPVKIAAAVPIAKAAKMAFIPVAKAAKIKTVLTKKGLALALLKMLHAHQAPFNTVHYGGSYYH